VGPCRQKRGSICAAGRWRMLYCAIEGLASFASVSFITPPSLRDGRAPTNATATDTYTYIPGYHRIHNSITQCDYTALPRHTHEHAFFLPFSRSPSAYLSISPEPFFFLHYRPFPLLIFATFSLCLFCLVSCLGLISVLLSIFFLLFRCKGRAAFYFSYSCRHRSYHGRSSYR